MTAALTPILSIPELREVERRHADAHLMELAGTAAAEAALQLAGDRGRGIVVLAGPGNNGGDALVAAEQLQRIGWKIDIRLPFAEDTCSELTQKKLKALRDGESGRGLSAPKVAALRPLPH
jgi:NAD(P)H-hydrate repair Nnr-like enzyme with NAD(P)H-hydrate epimerase domain